MSKEEIDFLRNAILEVGQCISRGENTSAAFMLGGIYNSLVNKQKEVANESN